MMVKGITPQGTPTIKVIVKSNPNQVICPKWEECKDDCPHKTTHEQKLQEKLSPFNCTDGWNCPACVPVKPEVKEK